MLIGIYLVLPIVGRWLETASDKDIRTVLCLWGVSLIVPYIQYAAPFLGYQGNYGNLGILGVCGWNAFGSFYYVSGFMGYMILANYLIRRPIRCKKSKLMIISSVMFVIGLAVTVWGYMAMMPTGNWTLIEMFWSFCSINVLLMTLPVFLWAQRFDKKVSPWLSRLAIMSFGVYLCHFSIVQWGYEIFYATGLSAGVRLLLNILFSTAISYFIVFFMFRSRVLRRFVA